MLLEALRFNGFQRPSGVFVPGLRILHLSDLHARVSQRDELKTVVEPLLRDVARMHAERPVDLVIWSGDLAYSGGLDQYELATQMLLHPLLGVLGIEKSRIVVVPGNHDVDRALIDDVYEAGLTATLNGRKALDSVLHDPAKARQAAARLSGWRSFHEGFFGAGAAEAEAVPPFGRVSRLHIDGLRIGVVALDSAWRASGDLDRGRLLLGEAQVRQALDAVAASDVRLVVFHHPLAWLAPWDADAVRTLLEQKPTVTFTGHDHVADPIRETTARGAAVHSRAGCLHDTVEYLNSYSFVDLDPPSSVMVRMRTWWPDRQEFDEATNRAPGGAVRFDWPSVKGLAPVTQSRVTGALVRILDTTSVAAVESEPPPRSVTDLLVRPRLWPADFSEIRAAASLSDELPKPLNVDALLAAHRIVLIAGDPESGVTGSLLWTLGHDFETSGERTPVYVPWKRPFDPKPFRGAIREELSKLGVPSTGPDLPRLRIAVDDFVPGTKAAMKKFTEFLRENSRQAFLIGCHGGSARELSAFLDAAGVGHTTVFLGPLSRRELRHLVHVRVGAGSIDVADRVLGFVRGQSLPATPAILSSLVDIVSRQIDLSAINPSGILDAQVRIMLGEGELEDPDGLGLDSRRREYLLAWFASLLTNREGGALPRLEAERLLGEQLQRLGWSKAFSPGEIIGSLIRRRVLMQDVSGDLGFRHGAFFHLFVAKWMPESPDFTDQVLADPLRYAAAVVHAAGLQRNNRSLLTAIAASLKTSQADLPITVALESFDEIAERGPWAPEEREVGPTDVPIDEPGPSAEDDHALVELPQEDLDDLHERMQLPMPALGPPLSPEIQVHAQAVQMLSRSLRTAELVDDVELKVELFKQAVAGWAHQIVAGLDDEQIRPYRKNLADLVLKLGGEEALGEEEAAQLGNLFDLFAAMVFQSAVSRELGGPHMTEIVRQALEDPVFMEPTPVAMLATMVAVAVKAPGWPAALEQLQTRFGTSPLISELTAWRAFLAYLSPETSDADARRLENLLVGAGVPRRGVARHHLARGRPDDAIRRLRRLRTRQAARGNASPSFDELEPDAEEDNYSPPTEEVEERHRLK